MYMTVNISRFKGQKTNLEAIYHTISKFEIINDLIHNDYQLIVPFHTCLPSRADLIGLNISGLK